MISDKTHQPSSFDLPKSEFEKFGKISSEQFATAKMVLCIMHRNTNNCSNSVVAIATDVTLEAASSILH